MLRLSANGISISLERDGDRVLIDAGEEGLVELPLSGAAGVRLSRRLWLLCDRAPEGAESVLCERQGTALLWDEGGTTLWVALVPLETDGIALSFRRGAASVGRLDEDPIGRSGGWMGRLRGRMGRGSSARAIRLSLPGDGKS